MAKKSSVAINNRRRQLAEQYADRRNELRAISKDPKRSMQERMQAREALARLPLNSNPIRVRNRCALTGRPRAYIRQFGLSRIAFRELALKGLLPGVRKASW